MEEFAEVTVLEPLDEEAKPSHIPAGDCGEVRRMSQSWVSGGAIHHGHEHSGMRRKLGVRRAIGSAQIRLLARFPFCASEAQMLVFQSECFHSCLRF